MVSGIKNSTQLLLKRITSYTLNAKVNEWPIVNAVTRISACFQYLSKYKEANAKIKVSGPVH